MQKVNEYRTKFFVQCPANGKKVQYKFCLRTSSVVMVEDIMKVVSELDRQYHEVIADRLIEKFGGHQKLKAYHHGVSITTIRSSNEI